MVRVVVSLTKPCDRLHKQIANSFPGGRNTLMEAVSESAGETALNEKGKATSALPHDHPMVQFGKIGVLLVNLGTPDAPTAKALRPYLRQFLSDPRVIEISRFKWQLILNLFVFMD